MAENEFLPIWGKQKVERKDWNRNQQPKKSAQSSGAMYPNIVRHARKTSRAIARRNEGQP